MATISNIGFVVLINIIFFNIATCSVYQENSLTIVTVDLVVEDLDHGAIRCFNSCLSVHAHMMVLFDTRIVFFTFDGDSVFEILFYPVIPNDGIRSKIIFCYDLDAMFSALSDLVHHDVRI